MVTKLSGSGSRYGWKNGVTQSGMFGYINPQRTAAGLGQDPLTKWRFFVVTDEATWGADTKREANTLWRTLQVHESAMPSTFTPTRKPVPAFDAKASDAAIQQQWRSNQVTRYLTHHTPSPRLKTEEDEDDTHKTKSFNQNQNFFHPKNKQPDWKKKHMKEASLQQVSTRTVPHPGMFPRALYHCHTPHCDYQNDRQSAPGKCPGCGHPLTKALREDAMDSLGSYNMDPAYGAVANRKTTRPGIMSLGMKAEWKCGRCGAPWDTHTDPEKAAHSNGTGRYIDSKAPLKEDSIEDTPSLTAAGSYAKMKKDNADKLKADQSNAEPGGDQQKGKEPFNITNSYEPSTVMGFQTFVVERIDPQIVTSKDTMRISDIIMKSKGNDGKATQLAQQMANSIDSADKALRRAQAAKLAHRDSLAAIFYDRYKYLLSESTTEVFANDLGFKPIKGKHQRFAYPEGISYGGREWMKQPSGGEFWSGAKSLDAIKYADQYGNILQVNNDMSKVQAEGYTVTSNDRAKWLYTDYVYIALSRATAPMNAWDLKVACRMLGCGRDTGTGLMNAITVFTGTNEVMRRWNEAGEPFYALITNAQAMAGMNSLMEGYYRVTYMDGKKERTLKFQGSPGDARTKVAQEVGSGRKVVEVETIDAQEYQAEA